jgi:spheroidene monooxygenase
MMQMLNSRRPMRKSKGLLFFKPLGTGSGAGYSSIPDFSVYGMLAVWESHTFAAEFLSSPLFRRFIQNSNEQFTVFLNPISSRGSWSGFDKWEFSEPGADNQLICALTRATLRLRFLSKFWSLAPRVSEEHKNHRGLLFSKGIGEYPWIEQATFSIWENTESLDEFANNTFHRVAIDEARKHNGFKEEMFTRFKPYHTEGTWQGRNLLRNYLKG